MRIPCAIAFICGGIATAAAGQDPEDISVELAELIDGSQVPALAAAAIVDGEIGCRGASGIRKQGEEEKVTAGDKFHIGSCTKSMTAVLAAMLVESGKIEWDTTVTEVFSDVDVHEDFKTASLRQLVSNTGGTPGKVEPRLWGELWKAKGTLREQRMELVRGILEKEPAYLPGTKQVYSNAGFAIAGAMLETRADKAYEELLTEKLFVPLKMESAGFRAPATNGEVDQPYGHSKRGEEVVAHLPEPRGDNPSAIAPAGGVHCSVTDLARYAWLHLDDDSDLLTAKSLETLHTPEEGRDYAMGWGIAERGWAGGTALTHTGSNTMFYAVIWLAPERDFVAVAMCNLGGRKGFERCDKAIGLLVSKYLKELED